MGAGSNFTTYRVDILPTTNSQHKDDIPPTPDNQHLKILLDTSISQSFKDQYVLGSLFTGGHNYKTCAHLKEKLIESETSHPHMMGAKGSFCWISGCDAKVMTNEQGVAILPCECDFRICRDCYRDAVRTGDGICPGCKESYNAPDEVEVAVDIQHCLMTGKSKMEERCSAKKSTNVKLMRTQIGELDHTLIETRGIYGYGNVMWP